MLPLKQKYKISVIGLGFVGLPTSIVLANSKKKFLGKDTQILGIDKDKDLIKSLKRKIFPLDTADKKLIKKFKEAIKKKKINFSSEITHIHGSRVIVISVNVDFRKNKDIENFRDLIAKISKLIDPSTLVVIESTLAPGTCDNLIRPIFEESFKKRKLNYKKVKISYSYERVTPGENYYNSIINSHRSYSGNDKKTKRECRDFLNLISDQKKFHHTEFDKNIDCESAKILENSFRSLNIAFIDEWVKFANFAKINLNKIIQSIHLRPTHKNLMWPGVGVGGYCLTKDPEFLKYSTKKYFTNKLTFPLTSRFVDINRNMPNTAFRYIEKLKDIKNRKILIIGATYKSDVGDFRFSPSLDLALRLKKKSKVHLYDPYINAHTYKKFPELKSFKSEKKLDFKKFDIIIFSVLHNKFSALKKKKFPDNKIYIDLCRFNERVNPKIKNINIFGEFQ